jgi:hypothetical protein
MMFKVFKAMSVPRRIVGYMLTSGRYRETSVPYDMFTNGMLRIKSWRTDSSNATFTSAEAPVKKLKSFLAIALIRRSLPGCMLTIQHLRPTAPEMLKK